MGGGPSKPIPNSIFKQYLEPFKDTNIISIGSGDGYLEDYLEKQLDIKITCIDPDPETLIGNSYHGHNITEIIRTPDYKYIDEYLNNTDKSDKRLTTLLLFWTYPNKESPHGGKLCNSSYDIEALHKLKPNNVIVLYDPTGSAGSSYLHYWLNKSESINLQELANWTEYVEHSKYKVNKYYKQAEYVHIGSKTIQSLILMTKTNDIKYQLPEKVLEYK